MSPKIAISRYLQQPHYCILLTDQIDNILLDRLFQIPQLEDLNINATPEELTTLVEHLPKLKTINGNLINRHIIKKQKLEDEKKGLHKKLTE